MALVKKNTLVSPRSELRALLGTLPRVTVYSRNGIEYREMTDLECLTMLRQINVGLLDGGY